MRHLAVVDAGPARDEEPRRREAQQSRHQGADVREGPVDHQHQRQRAEEEDGGRVTTARVPSPGDQDGAHGGESVARSDVDRVGQGRRDPPVRDADGDGGDGGRGRTEMAGEEDEYGAEGAEPTLGGAQDERQHGRDGPEHPR
jgi:hypothetical protein